LQREDQVEAKGKGKMKTYWLLTLRGEKGEITSTSNEAGSADAAPKSSFMERIRAIKETRASKEQRIRRLVDWNSEMLIQLLKQIVARRAALQRRKTSPAALAAMARTIGVSSLVVEEVAESITLPEYDARICKIAAQKVELSPAVIEQTRKYVEEVGKCL
jgi:hypothetical protein